jgi:type I restriction enzyme S subunit
MNRGWEIKKIGDVCTVIAGQSPQSKFYNSEGKGLPFYQGKKEFGHKFLGEPTSWTTQVTKEAQAEDILMSVRAPVGPVNFATERICIGRGLAAIRPGKLIDKNFLFLFLLKNEKQIEGNPGAVFSSINKKQIEDIEIPLPPLPEQRRIVAILDEAFAAIDKAKANTEQNLRNSRELFESYLQGVFEGSTQDWREDTLLNISTVRTGKWDANHATENGRYRFYTCAYQYAQCDTAKFSGECLILPGNGVNVGEVFYYKGEFDAYQRTYVLFDIKINPRFLHFHMLLYWRRLGTKKQYGSATNFIKMGNFEEYSVRFPSTTEQQKLVAEIEQTQLKVQELEDNYHRKLQDLEELKKSLLQKAFSGEIQIPIELA